MTLARVKNDLDFDYVKRVSGILIPPLSCRVTEFCIFESVLTPMGPEYKIRKKIKL